MKVTNSLLLKKFLSSTGISTDTRKIEKGNLFFALKGPNFNANILAKEALEKGASCVVIDDPQFDLGEKTLLVQDGLKALQDLALQYRKTLSIPIIGLTGSNGKTTTKELIFSVLSQKYKCFATTGNLNNHIGVPLSILSIKPDDEIAVIEMGANKQGDIKELADIGQPTHGLITNIGKAHLEGFGGIEGVKKGKGELFDFLALNSSTVFLPEIKNVVHEMYAERVFSKTILANQEMPIQLVASTPTIIYQTTSGEKITTQLPGVYNLENIQMAIAIGKHFELTDEACNQGIANYLPSNHRSQFIKSGSNQVLMDAYNANPTSMNVAISHFAGTTNDPKVLILGDMFELGDESMKEHADLGKLISSFQFEKILLVGEQMQHALIHLPHAFYFPDKFGLHNWLQDNPIKNSFILIKGSRGIQLESVLPFLTI